MLQQQGTRFSAYQSSTRPSYCTAVKLARETRGTDVAVRAMQGGSHSGKKYPPGVQDMGFNVFKAPKLLLSDAERVRLDENPDSQFYTTPRMMQHAEQEFIDALTGVYHSVLSPGAHVLELCASAHSHMPQGLQLGQLVGQGMNSQELAANQALSQWFVLDLNQQPLLLEQLDGSYDAVVCVNGMQYLTQPEQVIAEAWRVLRPGGFMLTAFGSHFFPEKALAGWISRNMTERCDLLSRMLKVNGFDQVLVMDSIESAQVSSSSSSGSSEPVQLRIIVATKPTIPLAGTAGAGSTEMRPDNVAEWFTKPGLTGLAEWAPAGADSVAADASDAGAAAGSGAGGGAAGGAAPAASPVVNERLVEQWLASYDVMVSDAVVMGIPRSVIPDVPRDASPAEIQAAVQHLQDMVASFLSSGL